MRLRFLVRRRPSAAMVVALIALFAALGGVGWAATQLPANSVGTAQLQNASVTNHKLLNGSVGNFKLQFGSVGARKLQNGAVGASQINSSQVQARVTGTCASGAIGSITNAGKVGCVPAPPQEFGSSSGQTTLGAGSTPIASKSLPGGSSYLVFAYPHAVLTSGSAQHAEVDCTLAVTPGSGAPVTRDLTVDLDGTAADSEAGTIPLVFTAPSVADATTASVRCTRAKGTATVNVTSTINAIQTASNG